MSDAKNIEKMTSELIAPILEDAGVRLVDTEYVKEDDTYYLRVYIDKEGGVSIDDCVDVSRAFNPVLDCNNYIPDAYVFEVSSPGADRVLKKDGDLEFALGRKVLIKTYKKIDNKKEFEGELIKWDDKIIVIKDSHESTTEISRSDISLIRLAYNFEDDLMKD